MAIVSGGRSTLNPDAPLFIPAVFRQVEDFSPEWWELVKTSTWFHDYWLNQHQEEEELVYGIDEDDYSNDIANLLPESFDFNIDEDFPNLEAQLEELVQSSEAEENDSAFFDLEKERHQNGSEVDAVALMKNLSLSKSSKEKGHKPTVQEHIKHLEKPVKCVSPKCSPRRIHQPR